MIPVKEEGGFVISFLCRSSNAPTTRDQARVNVVGRPEAPLTGRRIAKKNEHNGIIFHGCRSRSTLAEPIEHDRRIDLTAHVPRCYLELDYVNSSDWLFAVFTNTATNQRDTQRVDRCRLSGEFAPRSNRLGFYACHELCSYRVSLLRGLICYVTATFLSNCSIQS